MRIKSRVAQAGLAAGLLVGGALVFGTTALGQPAHQRSAPSSNLIYVANGAGQVTPDTSATAGAVQSGRPSWGPSLRGCSGAPYATIGAAVSAASSGSTIVVCPGVYREDVVVPASEQLTIEGLGDPEIDALDLPNGVQVLGSGTTIEGFTVAYAIGEGILVGGLPGAAGTVSNVSILDNTVIGNDQGNPTGATITSSSYAECNGTPGEPGDCGEGIHLLSADNSKVVGNELSANSGGILLSDENGPTDGDLIAQNVATGNLYACGITLAGHHLGTTMNGTTWAAVAPSAGGVFNNTVRDNQSVNNGVMVQGGGVLLASPVPGGAVYDNLIEGNYASGNGLAGVTVHSHGPGEDLNGNVLRANDLGANDLDGDPDFGGNTPPAIDSATTGVIVATALSPISITITGNFIHDDTYGIWETPGVTATTAPPPNVFSDVATPILTAP